MGKKLEQNVTSSIQCHMLCWSIHPNITPNVGTRIHDIFCLLIWSICQIIDDHRLINSCLDLAEHGRLHVGPWTIIAWCHKFNLWDRHLWSVRDRLHCSTWQHQELIFMCEMLVLWKWTWNQSSSLCGGRHTYVHCTHRCDSFDILLRTWAGVKWLHHKRN